MLLSDKTKAPTYYMKQIPDDPDTHIIVFTAGPPYEDIAFRIVRRPWEYSHRKGFRSMFDRGVLQRTLKPRATLRAPETTKLIDVTVYFNFGRAFYRK